LESTDIHWSWDAGVSKKKREEKRRATCGGEEKGAYQGEKEERVCPETGVTVRKDEAGEKEEEGEERG